MSNLTSTLTIALNEDITSKAPRAAGALRQLGASGADLKKLASASPEMARLTRELERLRAASGRIDLFKGASANLDQLGIGLRKARQEVARFDAQIASRKKKLSIVESVKAGDPSRYEREFKSKGITVEALALRLQGIERKRAAAAKGLGTVKAEFMEQGRAVRDLGRELTAAGVPLRGLKAAEDGLRASIEGVNREIARQPALFAASQARADAAAKANAAMLRATIEAARAERAARVAAQASAATGKARADASRPAAAEAARAAVERGRAERRSLREDADLLNRMGADAADVRKVPELAEAVAARRALTDKAGAIEGFRVDTRGLKEAGLAYRRAEQDVRRLKAEMAAAPSDAVAQRLAAAQMAAVRAGEAFRAQGQAARASRLALAEAGISVDRLRSSEQALAGSIREATAALAGQTKALAANQRAASDRAAGREARDMAFAVAAPIAGGVVRGTYTKARDGWVEMDEATRRQRAILDFNEDQQKGLTVQAYKVGQDTRFTNPDVVRAQTRVGSGLPDHLKDPKVIAAITEQAKDYALAMGTTIDQGSEAILGRMLGLRMDMSTPEAAAGSAKHAANRLVQFAKSSGADHNDVMGYTKVGAAPGSVGGFSEEFSDAMAAQLRRIGYEGSMAGNFVRAGATRLAVPTSKGHAVLAASGKSHSDYVAPGRELSAQNLNAVLKGKFGKSLSGDQMARIHALMQDETIVGNREEFIPQASSIIQETLARKNKNGAVNAADAERIAKTVDQYLNAAAGAVDIERLMRDIISGGITPAMAKYLFGQEHGGRAQSLDAKTLDKDVRSFKNTPENRAQKVGQDAAAGAAGAYQRLIGSIETFYTRLGEVNDGPLTRFYNLTGNAIDGLAGLPNGVLQAGTAITGLAGAAVAARGALGAFRLARDLMGFGGAAALTGSATALGGSAAALDAAAVALTRAALAQGGKDLLPNGKAPASKVADTTKAVATGAGGAFVGGGLGGLVTGLTLGGGAVGGAILADAMPKAVGGVKLGAGVADLAALRRRLADGEAAGRSLGYAKPGRAVELPGGAAAAEGVSSTFELSRGVLGDFLLGREKRTERLPLPPSMARPGFDRLDLSEATAAGVAPSALAAVASPVTIKALAAPPPAPGVVPRLIVAPVPAPAPAAGVVPRVAAPLVKADRAARDPRSLALPPAPDAAGIAEVTAALAAFKSELSGVKADLATGLDMPGIGTGLEARKAELERLISDAQAKLQALGAETVAPTIDGAGLDAFGGRVDGAQAKLSALGATSVTPNVGTGPIDALLSKLDAVLSKLSQVGSAATSANARIGQVNTAAVAAVGGQSTGRVGQRLAGGFTNSTG